MLENKISDTRFDDDNYIRNMNFESEVLTDVNIAKIEFESVQVVKCQFINCNFSKAGFHKVVFANCLFSGCILIDSYQYGMAVRYVIAILKKRRYPR